MSRLLVLIALLTVVACAKNEEQAVLRGNATINHSFTSAEDTIMWSTSNGQAGLTIESTDSIQLDFGGALIHSDLFGKSPDQYTGVAIHILRAPAITIQNATFTGFQTGILVEAETKITLRNCHFVDFQRQQATRAESTAVRLQQSGQVNVEASSFRHLDRAFELPEGSQLTVTSSHFHWLSHQVLQASTGIRGDLSENQFFYIGLPEQANEPAFPFSVGLAFRQNTWAHVSRTGRSADQLLAEAGYAYLPEITEEKWSKTTIDPFLREIGVSTPDLELADEWGWFDYSYPKIWPRDQTAEKDIYLLTAPNGNWRLVDGAGYQKVVPKTGSFPTTLQAFPNGETGVSSLEFEYLGKPLHQYGVRRQQVAPITFSTQP